ncbi:MAG: hypothetical protein ABI999_10935 [Acidobacteriota bacterium]
MFISNMLGDGPSLTTLWIGFVGLGLIGFCLSLLRWWALIPVIIILCFWAFMLLDELYAADLYPDYSKYPEFLYPATAAIVVGTILPFVGILLKMARRFNRSQ